MRKLVECVPNFSEGRDQAIIDSITGEIGRADGVTLLDVDPGADTNRTVVTMVGEPEAVLEAAFLAIRRAGQLIDMARHSGAHPRMGATDVCPFVPVSGLTMDDCAELARRLGKRVGEELGIPVYLYEHAASRPERQNLADVRQGEYEGLADREGDDFWVPDFGPARFNARSGATAIGAREFLIAYNINFNTRDKKPVNDIALEIRAAGRNMRDENGKFVRDENGNPIKAPGKLKAVKAIGWYIEDYGVAQLSVNLTSHTTTPLHLLFETVREEARKRGLRATGSELVGLIPLDAILEAGRHYLDLQGGSKGIPELDIVHIAVKSLGLDELYPFEPKKKIIEYAVREKGELASLTVEGFCDVLSTDAPAPGGGSVAALCGALSSALTAMVGNLTTGKEISVEQEKEAQALSERGQKLKAAFVLAIDEDTRAFNRVMDCFRLPRKTDGQKAARQAAIEEANKGATMVPLDVLRRAVEALGLAEKMVPIGNPNCASDAGVAGLTGRAAAHGAYYNALINLAGITDQVFCDRVREEAEKLKHEADEIAGRIAAATEAKLTG
jgi:glutamate formiminotransferase/formiminotetrahydrofolate cyclodeaminase